MSTQTEARLRDLAVRDSLARDTLGPGGEKLKRALDARLAPVPGPDRLQAKGLLDWFVYDDFATGRFENIDAIHLRWVAAASQDRLLEYVPDAQAPFAFVTSGGRRIVPGRFLTDGGTIPDFATLVSGIDRFAYLPAYLIHDWEYVLHHCRALDAAITREDADRALLEALKTMMAQGLVPESRPDLWKIETALANFAGAYWNADTECSL